MKVQAFAALLLAAALSVACEPPNREIQPGYGPASGAIAATRDGQRLLIAAEDHDQLLVLDAASKAIQSRVDVGDAPVHVIELQSGNAAVTTRYGHSVVVVDVARGRVVSTINVGTEPYGLTEIEPGRLAVVLAGDAQLAIVDVSRGQVVDRIDLADRDPRAVARLPNGDLFVTHMSTGSASRISLTERNARRIDVNIRNDFGPKLTSEHLRSVTVDPDEQVVITPGTCANTETVRAPIGEPGGDVGGESCGYSACPTQVGAVPGCLPAVDVTTDQVIVANPAGNATDARGGAADCFDCGFGFPQSGNPANVLNSAEQRFAGTHVANPVAVALFDGGRGQIVVNLGSKNALLLRRDLRGRADDVIATVKLGNGAQSIALSPDGKKAYVWNQFDLTVSEIELPRMSDQVESRTKFVPDQNGEPMPSAELGVVPELAASTIALGLEDALSVEASIGRKLFHDATDSRIAAAGSVSCASCHPDGRSDNRTWKFVFGPRNTPQLGGGILETAPFHWPGDVPTVAALNDMTVLPFMGGTGLDSGSFSYVAAFIDSIRPAPSKVETAGMSDAALRGAEIFYSEAAQCSTCHAGAHFTDNQAWDVGTRANLSGMNDIARFQTPVLHGLNRSAPYLHDGSQATLDDLVRNVVRTDKMGRGSHLTDRDAADLVEFLKTL